MYPTHAGGQVLFLCSVCVYVRTRMSQWTKSCQILPHKDFHMSNLHRFFFWWLKLTLKYTSLLSNSHQLSSNVTSSWFGGLPSYHYSNCCKVKGQGHCRLKWPWKTLVCHLSLQKFHSKLWQMFRDSSSSTEWPLDTWGRVVRWKVTKRHRGLFVNLVRYQGGRAAQLLFL